MRTPTLVFSLLILAACGTPDQAATPAEGALDAATPAEAEAEPTPLERGAALCVPIHHNQANGFREETRELVLAPEEGMEYKYRLEEGQSFLYTWVASMPVHVEMHSQPDGAPQGYADSFHLHDMLAEAHGSYTANYPGIHGWYWENRTDAPVTVTVTGAGFFAESQEFRRGQPVTVRVVE